MRTILALLCAAIPVFTAHSQTINLDFNHDGLDRHALVKLPAGYDENSQYPLVLLLHPLGGNAQDMLNGSGMIQEANDPAHPFIIVAPDATIQALFNASEWNEGINPFHTVDDVSYIGAVLDSVIQQYPILTNRIYSTGFSDGGFMTNRLSCEMADRIAAFASVGGTRATSFPCNPGRAVPLFHIHGTADATVDYDGILLFGNSFLSGSFMGVNELMDDWINRNNCVDDITPTALGSTTTSYKYLSCDEGVELWHYKVEGGQHVWQFNSDFNTAEQIWDFFDDYTLDLEEVDTPLTDLHVYPNPSQGSFRIEFPLEGMAELRVYGSNGAVLRSQFVQSGQELDLGNLPNGLYFVQLLDSHALLSREKLMLQR